MRRFEVGTLGDAAYFLVCGALSLHVDGVDVELTDTKEPFGAVALVDPRARSGTVTATHDTVRLLLTSYQDHHMLF